MAIVVAALGRVEKEVIKELVSDLGSFFNRSVKEAPSMEAPEYALDRARGQFNSTAILNVMAVRKELMGFERSLGVIDEDLFASGLNFVFGEAGSRVAVISLERLRQRFYGRPENRELLKKRALTEAVHELGHTYGLMHCNDPFCVMSFSVELSDTDRKGHEFRGGCWRRMMELGLLK